MGFFGFIALLVAIWLLWNISRNTADALDKQTALQYEIVALEKRLDERLDETVDKLTEALKSSDLAGKAAVKNETGSQDKEQTTDIGDAAVKPVETVNINTATITTLTQLPKIGRATAQRIIADRPYTAIEDLKNVQGISEEIFASLKAYLTV
jgi:competence protein ComEA